MAGKRYKDITGQRFGKLEVIKYDHSSKRGDALWKCRCDCGNFTVTRGSYLITGRTKSCGCLRKEQAGEIGKVHGKTNGKKYGVENFRKAGENKKGVHAGRYRHGLTGTRLYIIWASMKQRCGNPKATEYSSYGGRGITVCEEWKNDVQKFVDWAITHGYASNLTIDRIDVNGNYEPDNCRWIPQAEQYSNMRNSKK